MVIQSNPDGTPLTLKERIEADMRECVTETMALAQMDVYFERGEPDWIEFALRKWGRPLLEEISGLEVQKAAERLQSLTVPATWTELEGLFKEGSKGYIFLSQIAMLQTFVKRAKEESAKHARTNGASGNGQPAAPGTA